jgi:hypothetical protein
MHGARARYGIVGIWTLCRDEWMCLPSLGQETECFDQSCSQSGTAQLTRENRENRGKTGTDGTFSNRN